MCVCVCVCVCVFITFGASSVAHLREWKALGSAASCGCATPSLRSQCKFHVEPQDLHAGRSTQVEASPHWLQCFFAPLNQLDTMGSARILALALEDACKYKHINKYFYGMFPYIIKSFAHTQHKTHNTRTPVHTCITACSNISLCDSANSIWQSRFCSLTKCR